MCAMRTLLYTRPNLYNLTMSRASSLYRLQELDLELDRSRARAAEIEAELADDQAIQAASERVRSLEDKLTAARTENLSAEHAVASQQEKIRSSEQAHWLSRSKRHGRREGSKKARCFFQSL